MNNPADVKSEEKFVLEMDRDAALFLVQSTLLSLLNFAEKQKDHKLMMAIATLSATIFDLSFKHEHVMTKGFVLIDTLRKQVIESYEKEQNATTE